MGAVEEEADRERPGAGPAAAGPAAPRGLTLEGVVGWLQGRFKQADLERTAWARERETLLGRLRAAEEEGRRAEKVVLLLDRRTKMLEAALRRERGGKGGEGGAAEHATSDEETAHAEAAHALCVDLKAYVGLRTKNKKLSAVHSLWEAAQAAKAAGGESGAGGRPASGNKAAAAANARTSRQKEQSVKRAARVKVLKSAVEEAVDSVLGDMQVSVGPDSPRKPAPGGTRAACGAAEWSKAEADAAAPAPAAEATAGGDALAEEVEERVHVRAGGRGEEQPEGTERTEPAGVSAFAFDGHLAAVQALAWDGARLATASADATVRLFDLGLAVPEWPRLPGPAGFPEGDTEPSCTLRGHAGPANSLALLGGARLVSGGVDGVKLWEVPAGPDLYGCHGRALPHLRASSGPTPGAVWGLAAKASVVASVDGARAITFLDVRRGLQMVGTSRPDGAAAGYTCLAAAEDEMFVGDVIGDVHRMAWTDLNAGRASPTCCPNLEYPGQAANSLAWWAARRLVVVGYQGGQVGFLDPRQGFRQAAAAAAAVCGNAFAAPLAADGHHFAIAGADGATRFWDLRAPGRPLRSHAPPGQVRKSAASAATVLLQCYAGGGPPPTPVITQPPLSMLTGETAQGGGDAATTALAAHPEEPVVAVGTAGGGVRVCRLG